MAKPGPVRPSVPILGSSNWLEHWTRIQELRVRFPPRTDLLRQTKTTTEGVAASDRVPCRHAVRRAKGNGDRARALQSGDWAHRRSRRSRGGSRVSPSARSSRCDCDPDSATARSVTRESAAIPTDFVSMPRGSGCGELPSLRSMTRGVPRVATGLEGPQQVRSVQQQGVSARQRPSCGRRDAARLETPAALPSRHEKQEIREMADPSASPRTGGA